MKLEQVLGYGEICVPATSAGEATPQGRLAARSDAAAGRVSEDIAPAEAGAEHKGLIHG